MFELRYPLFDGEKFWAGAAVTVENGVIASTESCPPEECGKGLLLPGLIDAHAHMETAGQVAALLRNGITTVCDVCASRDLIEASKQVEIVGSAGMAMGIVMNPRGYVEQAAANGARYIKVLLFHARSIGKHALCGIVKAAHCRGMKVAVHATELATVRQAVEAGADILLHVPMKEVFPAELARSIAQKGIAVAPTLVMMEAFSHSGRNGYQVTDYQNAEHAVRLLHESGVSILAATDANPGSFSPAVCYGASLHREMALLQKAGLPPVEVLAAATSRNADAFALPAGRIAPGKPATMLLTQAENLTDIKQIWIKGEPLL